MNLAKALENLGFSLKETAVYLACLELGSGGLTRITKKAGLPKSTTADILKSLSHRGLINIYIKKRRRHFSIIDPKILQEKVKRQENILNEVLPELLAVFNLPTEKPRVRFYEGRLGFRLLLDEVLNEAKELIAIGSAQELFGFLPDFFPQFSEERARRNIPLRILFKDSPKARERQVRDINDLRQSKLIKTDIPFSALFWHWRDKLAMVSFKKDFSIVVIEDPEIAQTFKAIFELIWSVL